MHTNTIRRSALILSLASILPHLVCCAIPVAAAIIALGSTVGLGAALASNPVYLFVDQYHFYFLALAVTGVVISGVANYFAFKMDCDQTAEATCNSKACNPNKRRSLRIFMLSVFLLALDLTWLATEVYVLDLHHHHHGHHGEHEHHSHH